MLKPTQTMGEDITGRFLNQEKGEHPIAIFIKIEIDKWILKFICKCKGPGVYKAILKKNNVRRIYNVLSRGLLLGWGVAQ